MSSSSAVTSVLCVPGTWASRQELVLSIAKNSPGFLLAGSVLMEIGTKKAFSVEVRAHEPQAVRAFEVAGRGSGMTPEDQAVVARHTFGLYVVHDGGTIAAASDLMGAASAVLNAGGTAVKVESTGKAHSKKEWLALSAVREKQRAALYHAYVSRPERDPSGSRCCVELAGESPVSVSAGAPSSRPRAAGEILSSERGVECLHGVVRLRGREQSRGPNATQTHSVNLAAP